MQIAAFLMNCDGLFQIVHDFSIGRAREHTNGTQPVECFGGMMRGDLQPYLEKWVYSVDSHAEMLEKRVGWKNLQALQRRETIREGYSI